MDTRERITNAFTEHLRHYGTLPNTVHVLCKELKISEREFFEEFGSLESLESSFWGDWISTLTSSISSAAEWNTLSARHRYLTFLFGFVEASMDMRSLIILRFGKLSPICSPRYLRFFEKRFKDFATGLIDHGLSTGEIASRGQLEMIYPSVLYIHFRAVISFLIKDESQRFERTDAFIEKTVAFAFDVLHTQAIDSAFDLARFLAPTPWRKMP